MSINVDMGRVTKKLLQHIHNITQLSPLLLNEKWARRVSGVYSNELANKSPDKAHAILTEKEQGDYLLSIRAPLNRKYGADILASLFPTGGGRKAAAGINSLLPEQLNSFISEFDKQFKV